MARATSPLRYPGGKTALYPIVSSILQANKLERVHYAEPFAGGCGLALALLYEGHVSDIHINDIDPSIWAFWHSVLNQADELTALVAETPVTVNEWRRQREVYLCQNESDSLALGFATFFLNRTNRSGIIKDAGVIGGLDQNGPYKLDCRFNREDLIRRTQRIAKYRNRIHLSRCDALTFISDVCDRLSSSTFFCIDPPYFKKSSRLYTNFYKPTDHSMLASTVLNLNNHWLLTYDNAPEIAKLYRSRRQFLFDINYSVRMKRRETELLIASKGLRLPSQICNKQVNKPRNQARS